MPNALKSITALLGLLLAFGCSDRSAETSGTRSHTSGDEGIVTTDADGKKWVTPDADYARERAEENAEGDVDETGLMDPVTAPGMNELE